MTCARSNHQPLAELKFQPALRDPGVSASKSLPAQGCREEDLGNSMGRTQGSAKHPLAAQQMVLVAATVVVMKSKGPG